MATKDKVAKSSDETQPVLAPILDGTGLPLPEQAPLTHPDPALLHAVPQDAVAEGTLARVENLLGKGHFGAALREAQAFTLPIRRSLAVMSSSGRRRFPVPRSASPTATSYAATGRVLGSSMSVPSSRRTADPAVREVAELAGKVFDDLTSSRKELISALRADAQAGNFTEWCGRKKTLIGRYDPRCRPGP